MRIRAHTLTELVIVLIIIGVVAAIAVPRIGRGAVGAGGSAVRADLEILRKAIEMYAAEHNGAFPTIPPSTRFVQQLTLYSDELGNTSATKSAPFIFGPYLVAVPKLKVGSGPGNGKGKRTVGAAVSSGNGWIYDPISGRIRANSGTATDERGVLFSSY